MTPPVVLASSAWAGLVIILLLYFVPSVVAFVRHHHNQWAIFALNLLLGWTCWDGSARWCGRSPGPRRSRRPSTSYTNRHRLLLRRHCPQSRRPSERRASRFEFAAGFTAEPPARVGAGDGFEAG